MADRRLFADVSSYQGAIDVAAYKRAGYSALMMKSSEGRTIKDGQFHRTWDLCASHRVEIRLAYHFAHPENNAPETEAREFLRNVFSAGARSTDLLVLDVEAPRPGTLSQAHLREWITRFNTFVKRYWGRPPMIYSGGWWWKPAVGDGWRPSVMRGYHHSAYTSNPYTNSPSALRPHQVAQQFTDGDAGPNPHSMPGIGKCDVNRWLRGDWEDFKSFARGTEEYVQKFIVNRRNWRANLS